MKCRVKWGEAYSVDFDVPIGTKQGGISSPGYFSLYVNDLIVLLRKLGLGCHVISWFIGCILFADDLASRFASSNDNGCVVPVVSCDERCK